MNGQHLAQRPLGGNSPVSNGSRRTIAPVLSALVLVSLAGCAGYQIGHRSLYRSDVYSVYVPVFESDSLRRNLGEQLTEAVIKRIELRTPYKVVSGVHADSVLSGRILQDYKYVVAENVNDDPRDIEVEFKIEVSWRDRRGDLISETYTCGIPSSIVTFGQAVPLIPESGQSVATAHLAAIEALAEQIVSRMEIPW